MFQKIPLCLRLRFFRQRGRLRRYDPQIFPYFRLSLPARNSLTRAVGVAAAVAADYTQCRLEPGDALLLCSDGLYSMVDPTTLRECARQSVSQEDSKCLIDAANSRGGRDNITAVIIWYEENRNG